MPNAKPRLRYKHAPTSEKMELPNGEITVMLKKKPRALYGKHKYLMQNQILAMLREGATLTDAAAAIGATRQWIRKQRKADKEFDEKCNDAFEQGTDIILKEMKRRAIDGFKKPIYQEGRCVGYEIVYSDKLLTTLAQAFIPAFKKQDTNVNHTHTLVGAAESLSARFAQRIPEDAKSVPFGAGPSDITVVPKPD